MASFYNYDPYYAEREEWERAVVAYAKRRGITEKDELSFEGIMNQCEGLSPVEIEKLGRA